MALPQTPEAQRRAIAGLRDGYQMPADMFWINQEGTMRTKREFPFSASRSAPLRTWLRDFWRHTILRRPRVVTIKWEQILTEPQPRRGAQGFWNW